MVEVHDNLEEPAEIPVPQLELDADTFSGFTRSYDKRRDILFINTTPKRAAISLDVGGHFWVEFDPETDEVVGIQIDDFESVFLMKYPELRSGWQRDKPLIVKPFKREGDVAEYLRFLIMHLQNIVKAHPFQTQMPPA